MSLTIPRKSANIIWKCSFLQLIPIISSLVCKQYGCTILNTAIFCTSLNYWRKPVLGLRRNIDICVVLSSAAFHIYKIRDNKDFKYIMTVTGLIFTLYPLSSLFQNIHLETSVLCHCCLQVILGLHTSYVYFTLM